MPPKEAEPSAWAKLTTPGAEFDRVGLTCPPPQPATARVPTCMLTLRCAQDELSDVLHWIRQVLALVLGLAYGCIPITGASGNLRSDSHSTRQLPRLGNFLCDLLSLQCRRFCSGSDPVCWFARSFFMVSVVPVHMYLVNYLDIDDKEHGGYIAVAIEGLPAAFATFTLCWMLSYSLLHAAELPV